MSMGYAIVILFNFNANIKLKEYRMPPLQQAVNRCAIPGVITLLNKKFYL
jgi:hypothetical protein